MSSIYSPPGSVPPQWVRSLVPGGLNTADEVESYGNNEELVLVKTALTQPLARLKPFACNHSLLLSPSFTLPLGQIL